MKRGVSGSVICIIPCLMAGLSSLAWAERVAVPDTLERLARDGGFEVMGLDKAKDAFGRDEGGATYPRLKGLLDDFNHVIVQAPGGGVSKVIIISRKTAWVPPPPPETPAGPAPAAGAPAEVSGDIVVATERRGTSHLVSVSLEGEGGKRVGQVLTVDTGADFVVLPASLLGPLGLQAKALEGREVQTANGKTAARLGRLAAVWFGDRKVADVQAAFIEDAKLGGSALLGMSVLSRYRMTIDDQTNRLTLGAKEPAADGKGPGEAGSDDPGPEGEQSK
jgi:clan AA aspartic protease (TIGR02281 family)